VAVDRRAQQLEHRVYRAAECVVFRRTGEEFGGLSNMAPGFPLRVNGLDIGTSEVLYQCFRFPHLPDVQRMLLEERSPMTAKMKSKPYRGQSRPDWDAVRVRVMRWCLRVKLAQNWRSFGALLERTGDRPIVESSRKDAYWGALPDENGDELRGTNVLGRLLMELRQQLRSELRDQLRFVDAPAIEGALLFGEPIRGASGSEHPATLPLVPQHESPTDH
jgi:type I restriction enzyme S subunit